MQESRSLPDPENPDKQDGGSMTQCFKALLVLQNSPKNEMRMNLALNNEIRMNDMKMKPCI